MVAGGAQQGVDCIAGVTEQVVARESAVGLHVADRGLDGPASFEFAFHSRREAAAPAREEDALGLVVLGALNQIDANRYVVLILPNTMFG